jgi:hypothetical protein
MFVGHVKEPSLSLALPHLLVVAVAAQVSKLFVKAHSQFNKFAVTVTVQAR